MSCQVNIVLTFLVIIIMFTRSPLASSHFAATNHVLLVECLFFLLLKILIFNILPFDNNIFSLTRPMFKATLEVLNGLFYSG